MAMKAQYYSVDGQVRAESDSGGFRSYVRDNIGSVVKTVSSAGAVAQSYIYKPFGEVWRFTGSGAMQRRFLWCGSWGYGHTDLHYKWNSYYVRARHYSGVQGMWTTVDPMWPEERAYRYCFSNPIKNVDSSGLIVIGTFIIPPPGPISCTKAWNSYIYTFCNRCRDESCRIMCDAISRKYYKECSKGDLLIGPFSPNHKNGTVAPTLTMIFYDLPLTNNYIDNCCDAMKHSSDINWFYYQVRNKGPRDYKQLHPQFRDVGNFNYGVMAYCLNLSEESAKRAAGLAQIRARTSKPEWGNWLGNPPYGDDPDRKSTL